MRTSLNEAYGEDFFSRWPNLYAAMWEEVVTCPLSQWGGVECGPGWRPLLEELSAKLEAMILALPEQERRHYRCVQIKEKCGGLRFYMRLMNDAMAEAIDEAEGLALSICEMCGRKLRRHAKGWRTRTSLDPGPDCEHCRPTSS